MQSPLDRVLARLVEGARKVLGADGAAVFVLDERGDRLRLGAGCGLPPSGEVPESVEVALSPLDEEALCGHSFVVADTRSDPLAAGLPGGFSQALYVGLLCEDGPVGTLHVYGMEPGCFDEAAVGALGPLVDLGVAAIRAAQEHAELEDEVDEDAGRFVRIATHELRSPVSVAQSLVRGVLKGYAGELTERQMDVFGRVGRRLDALEGLVNDLLDLAAARSPRLLEEQEPVLLNGSVGRAVLHLQPRAEEKGVDLALQLERQQLIVWGTEEGLDRVFVNLIDNAIKYTPAGGSVAVSMRRAGGEAQVEVADTGIGIPDEALEHLFDEFYRASNARALEEVGTGLGLSIVKDLVELYGGRIEVRSALGEGSAFTVSLPLHSLE